MTIRAKLLVGLFYKYKYPMLFIPLNQEKYKISGYIPMLGR